MESENLTEDLRKMNDEKKFWDFSTLDPKHPLHTTQDKNALGLFKLETGSDYITSFVGVRPKVYSIESMSYDEYVDMSSSCQNGGVVCVNEYKKKNMKRMKGVKKHIIRRHFTHDCYKRAVLNKTIRKVTYFTISSMRHDVTTDLKKKLGLSRCVIF